MHHIRLHVIPQCTCVRPIRPQLALMTSGDDDMLDDEAGGAPDEGMEEAAAEDADIVQLDETMAGDEEPIAEQLLMPPAEATAAAQPAGGEAVVTVVAQTTALVPLADPAQMGLQMPAEVIPQASAADIGAPALALPEGAVPPLAIVAPASTPAPVEEGPTVKQVAAVAEQPEPAVTAPEAEVMGADDAEGGDDLGDDFGDLADAGDDFDENDFEVDVDLEGDAFDDGLDLLQPDPVSYALQQHPPAQQHAAAAAEQQQPEQEAIGQAAGDLHAAAVHLQADRFLQGLGGEPEGAAEGTAARIAAEAPAPAAGAAQRGEDAEDAQGPAAEEAEAPRSPPTGPPARARPAPQAAQEAGRGDDARRDEEGRRRRQPIIFNPTAANAGSSAPTVRRPAAVADAAPRAAAPAIPGRTAAAALQSVTVRVYSRRTTGNGSISYLL